MNITYQQAIDPDYPFGHEFGQGGDDVDYTLMVWQEEWKRRMGQTVVEQQMEAQDGKELAQP